MTRMFLRGHPTYFEIRCWIYFSYGQRQALKVSLRFQKYSDVFFLRWASWLYKRFRADSVGRESTPLKVLVTELGVHR